MFQNSSSFLKYFTDEWKHTCISKCSYTLSFQLALKSFVFFFFKGAFVQKKSFQILAKLLINTMRMNFLRNFLRTTRVCFLFAAFKIFLSTSFGVILFHFLLQSQKYFPSKIRSSSFYKTEMKSASAKLSLYLSSLQNIEIFPFFSLLSLFFFSSASSYVSFRTLYLCRFILKCIHRNRLYGSYIHSTSTQFLTHRTLKDAS